MQDKQIIFIRHGEKKKGIHLSQKGIIRSIELVPFFMNRYNTNINIPDIIIAMRQNLNNSNRAFETIKPLADTLNIYIIHEFYKKDIQGLNDFIMNNLDKNILVCWEHKKIIDIVEKISNIKKLFWKKNQYTPIWILNNSQKTFKIFNQFKISKNNKVDYTQFKTEPIKEIFY